LNPIRIFFLGIILFSLCQSTDCEAQLSKRLARKLSRYRRGGGLGVSQPVNYFTIGGGLGYNNYFGDLSPSAGLSTNFNTVSPYFGGKVLFRFHPNFQLRAGLSYLEISASDADVDPAVNASYKSRYIRNLHFRNKIVEFTGMVEANLFPIARGFLKREYFDPYVFAGISIFSNNPQAVGAPGTTFAGEWTDLRPIRTENNGESRDNQIYSPVQIAVPFGAGVKMRLSNNFDLGFEIGYRFTFTNYLDDVGTTYLIPFTKVKDQAGRDNFAQDYSINQIRMNNRSGELYDSYGRKRFIGTESVEDLIKNNSPLFRFVNLKNPDGTTSKFYYYAGLERSQSPRGGAAPDIYIVSALHLYYIIPKKNSIRRRRR
jgi:hypothetical protein